MTVTTRSSREFDQDSGGAKRAASAGRFLAVDTTIAQRCARLHVLDPRSERDVTIAATALVHGLEVVNRNVGDFAATGLKLVDPWQQPH